MRVLVTGAAGFIGYHMAKALAARGDEVTGLDSINDYYDLRLKYGRLKAAGIRENEIGYGKPVFSGLNNNYRFIRLDICDKQGLRKVFSEGRFDRVCHLAAQAGVRYSTENPDTYVKSNIEGFLNILECCREFGTEHLVYASSSSVYGTNSKIPFSETDRTDNPASLYAATKKADELMAGAYASLYGIPNTGLRYFTVYGPWGRPDMAPMIFADAITEGRPLKLFNGGDMLRDFTYVDDITEGTIRVLDTIPEANLSAIYNIGCSDPVNLMDFISELEQALGRTAQKELLPMQPGDVPKTYADVSALVSATGYRPVIKLPEGIRRFARWYLEENPLLSR